MTTTDKGFLGNLENLRGFILERVLNEGEFFQSSTKVPKIKINAYISDPVSHFVTLLGTLPSPVGPSTAIIRIERLPFPSDHTDKIIELLQDIKFIESTDIVRIKSWCHNHKNITHIIPFFFTTFLLEIQYSWLLAWFTKHESLPDAKINIICPATETHIRKVCISSPIASPF